ncbi:hypothetical protein AM629_19390 [Photorhabdus heterorhabditis]|uniref:Uncharacterized protein n=2 Tax=Photorhabdus heterorhabditis TaxID=880156 RepID=A0ABR5K8R6_9GAMM|nr:hypothetical protein AM629_19390 [Photorhabdus heterorhabditis]
MRHDPLKQYQRLWAERQARTSLPAIVRGSLVAMAVLGVAWLLPYIVSLPCKPGTLLLASMLLAPCAGVYAMRRQRY